jgi:hypothetical protein
MTVQEMMAEIRVLPLEDKLELLEALTHALRDEWPPRHNTGPSVSRVRGLLKSDEPPPTDAELTDAYTDYLLEKYT